MRKIVKPSYDNGKNKPVRTTSSGITRRRPRPIRKGEPSWKIYYDTEEEYQNATKTEEQLRQKQTQQYLQKKDREAAKADKLFESFRSANDAIAEQINKPVISKKQIKQAQKEQEEKNINTWKPALNTVDLGINLVSLLRPNPYMYAGSMLWDAFQMGDDIATGDVPINSTASLLFDGIGYAGATNRLRPITIRIPRGRSTSGLPRSRQMTINTDKVADVTGTGFNVLDGSSDVYGIGKFGFNYANTQNPNLMFKPFSYDEGKDQILKSPARLQRHKKNELGEFDDGKDDHRYYDYIIAQSMLGNPTAKRMTGEDNRYIPAFGQGDRSNLVLGSYGNYATPSVMNIGGELMYIPNPWEVFPEWMVQNQSFRFNNPNDAIDFAESYKYSSPAFPEFFGVDNSVNYDKGKDSGIHIKKKNRGKFTAAAKRAGMGVQAYARKILNAPKGKYSSTLRKRANFARNFAH